MSSSHELCPICGHELRHSKYVSKACKIAGGKVMSFIESVCNNANLDEPPVGYPMHLFFQVVQVFSTDNKLLFESIAFPDTNMSVAVNYFDNSSEINYYPRNGTETAGPIDIIPMKDRILELDYPKLEKVINKINVLVHYI